MAVAWCRRCHERDADHADDRLLWNPAVRIYEMTSEGQWEQAAFPAVTLVLAGLLPIFLLMRQTEK